MSQEDAAVDGLSLFFEIRPGEKADIEVAAAAAIAWAQGIKAAAMALDPGAVVRVELVDATEGSLNWNTLLRVLDSVEAQIDRIERGGAKYKRVTKLAIGLASMAVITGPSTWDLYFGDEKFTPEDRQLLRELHDKIADDPDLKTAKQKLYRTVLKDTAITGVGIKEKRDDRPVLVVPQNLFPEGEGLWDQPAEEFEPRVRYREMDVVIVKPALVKTPRSWTFREEGMPEFDAVMRDPDVLAAGGLPETMHDGITIRVQMEFREIQVEGEWQLVRAGRSVTKVLDPPLS